MAETKKIESDSWQISGAETFTAVGDTAKGVAKELLSNVDSDVTSILLRVNFYGDPVGKSQDGIEFDGDMTVIR